MAGSSHVPVAFGDTTLTVRVTVHDIVDSDVLLSVTYRPYNTTVYKGQALRCQVTAIPSTLPQRWQTTSQPPWYQNSTITHPVVDTGQGFGVKGAIQITPGERAYYKETGKEETATKAKSCLRTGKEEVISGR